MYIHIRAGTGSPMVCPWPARIIYIARPFNPARYGLTLGRPKPDKLYPGLGGSTG